MNLQEKLEFFAPIWQIMRDENMSVEQVSTHSAEPPYQLQAGQPFCPAVQSHA